MNFETIAAIIADQFDIEVSKLTEKTDIQEDLNATSMDVVELIVAIESTTDIKIPEDAVDNIRTIRDIVNYLIDHSDEA